MKAFFVLVLILIKSHFIESPFLFSAFNSKTIHSMAIANLNKSEELVTDTSPASKYIPIRPRILHQWKPPLSDQNLLEVRSEKGDFN